MSSPTKSTSKIKSAGAKSFDKKFGKDFITSVPQTPGIYKFYDENDMLIYVGKAKRLRRRLQQYRNAKRARAHYKMRIILAEAVRLEIEHCESEVAALLAEIAVIQTARPRWNVDGAFFFLYPALGMKIDEAGLHILYTTTPNEYPEHAKAGCFRSRHFTREAYFAFSHLMGFLGHRESPSKIRKLAKTKHCRVSIFRKIPDQVVQSLKAFLAGESDQFLFDAINALLERPVARFRSHEVQESINALRRFYKFEILSLRKTLRQINWDGNYVTQQERDKAYILLKTHPSSSLDGRVPPFFISAS